MGHSKSTMLTKILKHTHARNINKVVAESKKCKILHTPKSHAVQINQEMCDRIYSWCAEDQEEKAAHGIVHQ